MAGNVPEIGVKLSAQGLSDVVNALKRVRQEANQAGKESASSFEALNSQLKSITDLLPAVTAGVVVEKVGAALISAAKGALDYAVSMGHLAEKTGVAVGPLSALALAARETGVEQDALSNGLIKLTKNAQEAADGAKKPKDAFGALGITLQDLKSKDPSQLFELVAKKLAGIQNPGVQAKAIIDLFGKAGNELVPVLNKLATEGLGGLATRAQQLGVYLSGQFVEEARRTKAALGDLGAVTEGMAVQFLSGLMPALEQVLDRMASVIGTGGGFKSWGQQVGGMLINLAEQVELLLGPLDHLGDKVKAYIADAKVIGTIAHTLDSPLGPSGGNPFGKSGAIGQIAQAYKDSRTAAAKADAYDPNAFQAEVKARYAGIRQKVAAEQNAPDTSNDHKGGTVSDTSTGVSTEQAEKNNKALLDLLQARVANELAILRLKNENANADDQRAYQAGLLSLDAYYDQREARINSEADKETQLLEQKRKQTASAPVTNQAQSDERQKNVEAIDTQIQEIALKRTAALKAAEDERAKDRQANAVKELEVQKELQAAAGDVAGAARTGLDLEIEKYEQLLKSQGKSVQEIAALSDAARTMGEAKLDFGVNSQQVTTSLQEMDQQIAAINDQIANGSTSQLEGAQKIHDLEVQRVQDLQSIVDLLQKQAQLSKDPALKQQADALQASLQHIKSGLQDVTTPLTYLQNQFQTVGGPAVGQFFTDIIDGSKSAGDAFKDLASTFEQIIAQMIAKMLVFYAIEAVVGFFAPDSTLAKTLSTQTPFNNSITGHQEGGFTANVGEDEVAGVVHGKEWVASAPKTRQYRPLIDLMEMGLPLTSIRSKMVDGKSASGALRGFQSGGFTSKPDSRKQELLPLLVTITAAQAAAPGAQPSPAPSATQYKPLLTAVRSSAKLSQVAPPSFGGAAAYAQGLADAKQPASAAVGTPAAATAQVVPPEIHIHNSTGQPAKAQDRKGSPSLKSSSGR